MDIMGQEVSLKFLDIRETNVPQDTKQSTLINPANLGKKLNQESGSHDLD